MATTTTTNVPHMNGYYDRVMLERAKPLAVHAMWGQTRNIPSNNSDTIQFRKYGALTPATTPLTEGTTPTGQTLSVTDVTATVSWYGDYVKLSKKLIIETFDPLTEETAEVLGEQMGRTLDLVDRDALNAGTNVKYAGGHTARNQITSADTPTVSDLSAIITTLKNANARKVTKFVRPDQGYNTTPVRASYVSICHTNTSAILEDLDGFEHVEKYANTGVIYDGEVGRIKDIRFVETTDAKVFSGEGSGGIDVYSTLVLGADAYGVTTIEAGVSSLIYKELGSAGTADPLNQRATMGWTAPRVAEILNQDWIVRYEHAVA